MLYFILGTLFWQFIIILINAVTTVLWEDTDVDADVFTVTVGGGIFTLLGMLIVFIRSAIEKIKMPSRLKYNVYEFHDKERHSRFDFCMEPEVAEQFHIVKKGETTDRTHYIMLKKEGKDLSRCPQKYFILTQKIIDSGRKSKVESRRYSKEYFEKFKKHGKGNK